MFPDHDELALHLSLCTTNVVPKKVRIGEAAGAVIADASCVACLFRFYSRQIESSRPAGAASADLYTSVVSALCTVPPQKPNSDSDTVSSTLIPLGFTTNLDNALEKALERRKVAHHVLFPVKLKPATDDGRCIELTEHAEWILRTWRPTEEDPLSYYLIASKMDEQTLKGLVEGPLLVKLRGAPLYNLDNVKTIRVISPRGTRQSSTPEGFRYGNASAIGKYEHRVQLSDVDFFSAVLQGQGVPNCVTEMVQKRQRLIYFMGYPLGDPSGLLGLHHDIRLTEDATGNNTFMFEVLPAFVDFPREPFRHASVSQLHMCFIEKPLETLLWEIQTFCTGGSK